MTLALAGLLGFFGALNVAHAGQPLNKAAASWLNNAAEAHAPAAQHVPSGRLDLTPPSAEISAAEHAVEPFPSSNRTKMMSSLRTVEPAAVADGHEQTDIAPSRAQALARNYQREGLPLAKLWQTKDSLVHIGLNNKGKPGLWIVEKLH